MRFLLILLLCFNVYTIVAQNRVSYDKGQVLYENGEYKKAIKQFKKEEAKSNFYAATLMKAYCYMGLEDYHTSKQVLLELTERKFFGFDRYYALVNLGFSYSKLEKKDSAYYYFDQAIEEHPEEELSYFTKGQQAKYFGDFDLALEIFNTCISLNDKKGMYFRYRYSVYFSQHRFDLALEDIYKTRELNEELHNEMNLAFCFSNLGRLQEADSVYRINLEMEDPKFLNNYGMNLYRLGQKDTALVILHKSLEMDENNPYVYYNLALIALEENDIDQLCKYLQRAKELNFKRHYGDKVDLLLFDHCSN